MPKGYLYIYDVKQNDFFVKQGLIPIEVKKGQTGNVYLKYIRDEKAEQVFNIWKSKLNIK